MNGGLSVHGAWRRTCRDYPFGDDRQGLDDYADVEELVNA